jgi:DNA-binding NtrC family response regulator
LGSYFTNLGSGVFHDQLRAYGERSIHDALIATNGNRSAAARALGLKRTTLIAWLRRQREAEEQRWPVRLGEGVITEDREEWT